MKNPNDPTTHFTTYYVVRDAINSRFLTKRTYSANTPNKWGKIGESFLFQSKARAASCAGNINYTDRDACRSHWAHVVPILVKRKNPTTSVSTVA